MSAVEVRFENLSVEADVHVGGRSLPTVLNSVLNFVEVRPLVQACSYCSDGVNDKNINQAMTLQDSLGA